jgi:hypothetical protein
MTVLGLLFGLIVWSVALMAGRKTVLKVAVPVIILCGVLVSVSIYAVGNDYAAWGQGLATGLALAIALHIGLRQRQRRLDSQIQGWRS